MDDVRPTRAVVRVVKEFVDNVGEPQYGYGLMQATGFSSAKIYGILGRLRDAGWLDRNDDPSARPESGGPPRVTYQLRSEAVRPARLMVAEAQNEFAPAPKRRRLRGAVQAMGWAQ